MFEYELFHRQHITKWGKFPFEPVTIPIRLLRLLLTELFYHLRDRAGDGQTTSCPHGERLYSRFPEPARSLGPDVGREEQRLGRPLGGSAAPHRGRRSRSGLAGAVQWSLCRWGSVLGAAVLSSALLCSFRAWERHL